MSGLSFDSLVWKFVWFFFRFVTLYPSLVRSRAWQASTNRNIAPTNRRQKAGVLSSQGGKDSEGASDA
jgi:hypothetical protein